MIPFADPRPASDREHVRDVVTRLFRAVEDADVLAYFAGTYHPDVVIHEAPSLPYGGDYHGVEGAAQHAEAFLRTWAPYRLPGDWAMDAAIDALPDQAYVRWTLRAAGRGFPFVSHYRFLDGLVVESRMFAFDVAEVLSWWSRLSTGGR